MLSYELKDKLLDFVEGKITTEQLEDWLVPRLPGFLASPDTADSDVIAAVELGLAEMADGIRTMAEFRDLLRDTLREQSSVQVVFDLQPHNESGATSQTSMVVFSYRDREISFSLDVSVSWSQQQCGYT
jgi:hypothetical protein